MRLREGNDIIVVIYATCEFVCRLHGLLISSATSSVDGRWLLYMLIIIIIMIFVDKQQLASEYVLVFTDCTAAPTWGCMPAGSLCLNDIVEEECDDGWPAVCRTNFNDSVQLLAKSLKLCASLSCLNEMLQ